MARKGRKTITDEELNKTVKNDNFVFASRLNKILEKRGMSQKDLADATGISPQTIGQYVHGQSECGSSNLRLLADKLSVSADYLLGRVNSDAVDITAAAICEYTGLTQAALVNLVNAQDFLHLESSLVEIDGSMGTALNDFLESQSFCDIVDVLGDLNAPPQLLAEQLPHGAGSAGTRTVSPPSIVDVLSYQASEALTVYLKSLKERYNRILQEAGEIDTKKGV